MLCIKPFRKEQTEFGCGQCIPCRINRRRMWTARIALEASVYPSSAFLTLTYNEENVPEKGSLSAEHWREFTKGVGFRYFGCGEYGGRTHRPHYHLVMFGLNAQSPEAVPFVQSRWPYGFVSVLPAHSAHFAYVAGYVVKKMTGKDHPDLNGRAPEFARMSRRPAIGWPALAGTGSWFTSDAGSRWLSENLDVPSSMRVSNRLFPMGRTLRSKLRLEAGVSEPPLRVFEYDPTRERRRVQHYENAKSKRDRVLSGGVL